MCRLFLCEYFDQRKNLEVMKKAFYFTKKAPFHSWGIQFFVFRLSSIFPQPVLAEYLGEADWRSILRFITSSCIMYLMTVKSKTNILYANMHFANLFFGLGRHWGKAFPESAAVHLFECLHSQKMWLLVNNSRNKRVSAFLLCFIGFETINFYIFFIKMSCFGSNLFFWKIKNY